MKENFCLKKDAYLKFSPQVNDSIIREDIGHFQVNIENAAKHINHICYYYSQFVDPLELESISDNNAVLMAVFKTNKLYHYDLNVISCCSGSFNFYHDCSTSINEGREPKFGIFNKIPLFCCQYYLTSLEDLISAEETVIIRIHPVVIILKLCPNNNFNPGIYRGVYRHSVLLLQNPGLLLTLLLLETTFMYDVM